MLKNFENQEFLNGQNFSKIADVVFTINVPNEDLSIKIINDSYKDSHMYFHYIKSIADFNFQNTFHSLSNNEGLMSVEKASVTAISK